MYLCEHNFRRYIVSAPSPVEAGHVMLRHLGGGTGKTLIRTIDSLTNVFELDADGDIAERIRILREAREGDRGTAVPATAVTSDPLASAKALASAISELDGVVRAQAWAKGDHRRIYVDLTSRQGSRRIIRGGQIYIDLVAGRIVVLDQWQGATTRRYHEENTIPAIQQILDQP